MTTAEVFGRTIQLFLIDGKPSGLRKATIHGWTGVAILANQSTFSSLTSREEVDRTGIYVLTGPDLEKPGMTRAYIGSANSVRDRIKQSAEKRDFWETAIAVTTSDDDLSKGHAEYLEARLIELTAQASRVTLENGTKPDTARRRLPEADIANMEQFLANLKIVFPVIGLDMLKPKPAALEKTQLPVEQRTMSETKFEIRHKSGVHAEAVEEDGEFVILEGSKVLIDSEYVSNPQRALKARLIEEGILVADSPNTARFAKPFSFSSPSTAAVIVLDRSSNGRTEWKVAGTKITYHQWQEQNAKKEAAE